MGRMLTWRKAREPVREVEIERRVPEALQWPGGAEREPSGIQAVAFYAALAVLFIRFATLSELTAALLGVNTYLLYIVGPPAIIGCLITGGFGRALKARPVLYWTGFFLCMLLSTPFSSWVGASAGKDLAYLRTDLVCLYLAAGLIISWKDVRRTLDVLGVAGLITVLIARAFAKPDAVGRLSLDLGFDGVISNSNDLAAHLVLTLPFVFLLILKPGRNIVVRVILAGAMFYGLWVILGTSSRGALIGLLAVTAVFFFRASGIQRLIVMAGALVTGGLLLAFLPGANAARLATLFVGGSVENTSNEADESMASRQYLLRQSIRYTLEHPVFGIGPSQFANFEGRESTSKGVRGNWHETHNTYTEISSECGIPALILALAGLLGAAKLVNQSYNAARKAGDTEAATLCLCFLASLTGYLVTIIFLACAYRFTLPAMIGVAVAIHRATTSRLRGLSMSRPEGADLLLPKAWQPRRAVALSPAGRS